jgi:hypothetical protein
MKNNAKNNCKIPVIILFLLCIIGCAPSNHPVYDDTVNTVDLNNQVSLSADLATVQPADLGQAPRTNCLSAAPKLNEECCWVWCEDQTVNIQTGTWHINRENGDFFCDLNPNKTSYDCSSTQLRCDDRNGGCVR